MSPHREADRDTHVHAREVDTILRSWYGTLSRAEPSRAEPSRAEPSRAEPSRAEPSRAEPSRAEPSRAEPSRAEPSRAEPSRAEPSRAEPSRAEPSRAEPSRAEPSRAEPSRAEPSRAEPSRAEPSRAEPSRAEPSRAEPSRAEPSRAEPSHSAHLPQSSARPRSPLSSCFSPLRGRATDRRGVVSAARPRRCPAKKTSGRRPPCALLGPGRGESRRTLSRPRLTGSTSSGPLHPASGPGTP